MVGAEEGAKDPAALAQQLKDLHQRLAGQEECIGREMALARRLGREGNEEAARLVVAQLIVRRRLVEAGYVKIKVLDTLMGRITKDGITDESREAFETDRAALDKLLRGAPRERTFEEVDKLRGAQLTAAMSELSGQVTDDEIQREYAALLADAAVGDMAEARHAGLDVEPMPD